MPGQTANTHRAFTPRWPMALALMTAARCADTAAGTGPATLVPWSLAAHERGSLDEPVTPPSTAPPAAPCGPCARPCEVGFSCVAEACTPVSGDGPRLLLPASLGRVTTRRPTLRWRLPPGADGARVEVCVDRACERVVARMAVDGSAAQPAEALVPGVYFWRVFPRIHGEYSGKASHTWSFVVRAVDASVDTSFGHLTDVNGDGFADVLLRGAEDRPTGVHLGGLDGPQRRADVMLPASLDGLTARVGSVGDVNGDGFADLLLSASVNGVITRAMLLPGAARPDPARAIELTSAAPWPRTLTGAGDLDGDGFADLLGLDPPRDGAAGRVRVWYGAPRGVHPAPRALLETAPDSGIGHASAAFGDLNGDALPDLLLGAPTHGEGQGRAVAWLNGRCADGALVDLGRMQDLGGRLGDSVALSADADGDGFVEAVVAAPFSLSDQGRSRVQVFPGAAEPISPEAGATLAFAGTQTEGIRLLPGGDYNGDGYSDLVVWMRNEQRGPSLRVFPGGGAGLASATPRVIYPQEFGATETALSAAFVGDTDRDGFDDLLVRLTPGVVFIARGGPDGLRIAQTPNLELP